MVLGKTIALAGGDADIGPATPARRLIKKSVALLGIKPQESKSGCYTPQSWPGIR